MNYIIDANNLAGSLGLLENDDFDKQLVEIIESWLGNKQKIVVLVFDSLDPMGDRIDLGNLEIVYSPRDRHYKTADDKIIEIFTDWAYSREQEFGNKDYSLNIVKKLAKDDLVFVSDDVDLRQKVSEIKADIDENTSLMWNNDFIYLLQRGIDRMDSTDTDAERGLSDDEVENINDELLSAWS